MTATTKTVNCNGLRWANDTLASGRVHAYAWWVNGNGEPVADVTAETESDAWQALRVAVLEVLRKPTDCLISNEQSNELAPVGAGGKYACQ